MLSVLHIAIKTLYLLFVCFRFFESIYSLHAFDCCLKPTVTYFISCPIVKPKKNAFSGKFSKIWAGGVADFQTRSYKAMTQGKIDLRNESGRPMKVKVVGEVSEK